MRRYGPGWTLLLPMNTSPANVDVAMVDEEKKTPWVQMLEVVAAVEVPKLLVPQVNGFAPALPPHALCVLDIVPSSAKVAHPAVPPAEETMRFVLDAVVAVMAVVEA